MAQGPAGASDGDSSMLVFADGYDESADLRLVELPEDLLQAVLSGDASLSFAATGNDDVMLCSDDTTYTVRIKETSNMLLMIPPDSDRDAGAGTDHNPGNDENASPATGPVAGKRRYIEASLDHHLEITPARPRLARIVELLQSTKYRGDDAEEDVLGLTLETPNASSMGATFGETGGSLAMSQAVYAGSGGFGADDGGGSYRSKKLYSFDQLLALVQSDAQALREGLRMYGAVEIDAAWRLLEPGYEREVLDLIIHSAIAEDWDFGAIPVAACAASMPDYRAEVVDQVCRFYALPSADDAADPNAEQVRLDHDKVARSYASQLLELSEQSWRLVDFLTAWRDAVPDEMEAAAQVENLRGLALIEETGFGATVKHFPASDLPMEPRSRFRALFQEKAQWLYTDIVPYIEDVLPPTYSHEKFLLRYARAFAPPGSAKGVEKTYSSRE